MTSNVENSCYNEVDWLYIFPEPIKFRVTSRIRIWRDYEKGLLRVDIQAKVNKF